MESAWGYSARKHALPMTADIVRTLPGPGFRVITRELNALE